MLNVLYIYNITQMSVSGPEIADLDEWISQLKQCHPLKESQVKSLCAKVCE